MRSIAFRTVMAVAFLLSVTSAFAVKRNDVWFSNAINRSSKQLKFLSNQLVDSARFPRTLKCNKLYLVSSSDWTSGFFPGTLWYAYELTRDNSFKEQAQKYTDLLKQEQYNKSTHDIGFMMYCSYGNAFRLSGRSSSSASVLVESANSLSYRYSTVTKTIRSWDSVEFPQFHYPVIIDNMMNLELLFWASEYTKNPNYKRIAINHANTTMKNHFRVDMSSYHVIDYDSKTGNVLQKKTFQGYADSSSWARGQGWGLYGYTMCYRFTKDVRYLNHAIRIAKYIMDNVKTDDFIPYWDYKAPNIPNEPRDASAGALTASALLELSRYSFNEGKYFYYAETILKNMSTDKYLSKVGENSGFILKHSVGSYPHDSEIDVPLNYADYYYLEALKRYRDYPKKK